MHLPPELITLVLEHKRKHFAFDYIHYHYDFLNSFYQNYHFYEDEYGHEVSVVASKEKRIVNVILHNLAEIADDWELQNMLRTCGVSWYDLFDYLNQYYMSNDCKFEDNCFNGEIEIQVDYVGGE